MALERNVPLLTHDHSGSGTRSTNQLQASNTHLSPDTDTGSSSLHHTLGPGSYQAASGSHLHAGQYMPVETNVYARYWNGGSQSIPAVTDTVVSYPTADFTSSLVVASAFGAGHQFNIRRAGIWNVTAGVRFGILPAGGGETYMAIIHNGGIIAANGGSSSNAVNTRSASSVSYMGFNTNVYINAYNAPISGTAAVGTLGGYGWMFIALTWLHD